LSWGVLGIYAGAEREIRIPARPSPDPGRRARVETRASHRVLHNRRRRPRAAAAGEEPTVGIHVYGGNIGTINRPSYDPATGAVQWFVSGWDATAA